MSKLIAWSSSQKRPFRPKIYQGKMRGQIVIIIIKIDIKECIDQTVVIEECHIEAELNTDKIIEEGHSMIKITEMILGKEILEERKITDIRILELDIEVILGMIILEEVEVGLETDSIRYL